MSATTKICAINISRLWYGDPSLIAADMTGAALAALLKNKDLHEITNIHQDTWTFEEAEATVTKYKNQLNNKVYRVDKVLGDVDIKATIGQYSYQEKADLMGGDSGTEGIWKRAGSTPTIEKLFVGLTEDDQYFVIPRTDVEAREATTDKAMGLPFSATELEPKVDGVASEYWFDGSIVKEAQTPAS